MGSPCLTPEYTLSQGEEYLVIIMHETVFAYKILMNYLLFH